MVFLLGHGLLGLLPEPVGGRGGMPADPHRRGFHGSDSVLIPRPACGDKQRRVRVQSFHYEANLDSSAAQTTSLLPHDLPSGTKEYKSIHHLGRHHVFEEFF